MLGGIERGWLVTDVAERFWSAQPVRDDSDQHSDTSGAKAEAPTYSLAQVACNEWSDEGTEVDSHVENRKASVPSGAVLRIEITDDCGDVRLEHPRAEHDQYQPDEERRMDEHDRERDREVAEGDENPTVPDRA